jgi:predicted dehydrogenase
LIGVAVVGCGYWGPNLVRNFSALDDCAVRAICDPDPERLEPLARRYPAARTVTDHAELLNDDSIDAVAIATPIESHAAIATAALRAGRHVLVEKPLAHSVAAAEALVELADREGLVLQVDHTFVYSGAVERIRSILEAGELGDVLYFDSVRVNLGLFQPDMNVVWDLAPHDVSVMTYVLDQKPVWVSAVGATHYGRHENLAYITVKFDEALIAHFHVNWLAPVKIRTTLIGGSQRMLVYDDLAPSEKIRVYQKGVTLTGDRESRERALIDYRVGDMWAPHLDKTEPLARVCRDFVDAVHGRSRPRADGRAGVEVVRILEAACESLRKQGDRVPL